MEQSMARMSQIWMSEKKASEDEKPIKGFEKFFKKKEGTSTSSTEKKKEDEKP